MENRKTLTLGGSYAIHTCTTSFSAPNSAKRVYIAFRGLFSDTILKNVYGMQAGASSGPRNENTKQKMHHVPGKTYGIKVEEVYPATIGGIEYAYATVDEIALLTVNFQYKKWKTLQLPSFLT